MTAGHSRDYLNKLELAERLGITRRNVEEMMRRRKISFIALGHRAVRFFWPAVEKALGRLEHKAIGQEAK
jgi:excisionase family DNA binding protein